MGKAYDEHRLAILRVGQNDLLGMWLADWHTRPVLDLPGAEVVSVHADFVSRSFCFVIAHESFKPAPFGEELPILRHQMETTQNPPRILFVMDDVPMIIDPVIATLKGDNDT